jgi:hypothetical protein
MTNHDTPEFAVELGQVGSLWERTSMNQTSGIMELTLCCLCERSEEIWQFLTA